jgi:hypothetical protein
MLTRTRATLTIAMAMATGIACRTTPKLAVTPDGSSTTSVFGHWVLAPPIDSTALVGATHVELVLAPSSFALTAVYPGRAPATVSGTLEVGQGGALTFTPSTRGSGVLATRLPPGQRFTRVATASGGTMMLALPSSTVPVPSSVWYRLDAARLAGLTP